MEGFKYGYSMGLSRFGDTDWSIPFTLCFGRIGCGIASGGVLKVKPCSGKLLVGVYIAWVMASGPGSPAGSYPTHGPKFTRNKMDGIWSHGREFY